MGIFLISFVGLYGVVLGVFSSICKTSSETFSFENKSK
jgi:hypothetical protein